LSANTTEHDKTTEVPDLPCPACIEAVSKRIGEEEFVPEYALHKYTFEQLDDHLNSDKHSREQLIEVAMRASIFLYRHAFEELESVQ
jgi:hypothetical protein